MSALVFETASALPPLRPERVPEDCTIGKDGDSAPSGIEVRRYVKPDGWVSRYWAVYIGSELPGHLVLYKRGA